MNILIGTYTLNVPLFVQIDNTNNNSDIEIPNITMKFNTSFVGESIISPSLKTTEGRRVKSGDCMELEYIVHYIDNQYTGILKRTFGSYPDIMDDMYM